ncbi:hypothetical protein D047_1464A, partial [Vibrio parahaemolyticus VPTS-2010_2]
MLYDV